LTILLLGNVITTDRTPQVSSNGELVPLSDEVLTEDAISSFVESFEIPSLGNARKGGQIYFTLVLQAGNVFRVQINPYLIECRYVITDPALIETSKE
jgi:hypothetical protein